MSTIQKKQLNIKKHIRNLSYTILATCISTGFTSCTLLPQLVNDAKASPHLDWLIPFALGGGGTSSSAPPVFPPAQQPPAPEGKDLLSTSTNFSKKAEDPSTKARGPAGASFIKPPSPNNYGAVSLSYNIDVPAGRAGVQPGLALGYSSNSGDGWVGMGWNVGLSAVSRSTSQGELYYDHRDTFTLGGKRLIKVSGASNSEDGVYRMEIESDFSRYELSDSANGGVWKVYSSSGSVTTFGATRSERIYHPDNQNNTFTWNLSRVEDRNGNYMEAFYDVSLYNSHHIIYLKEIRYTGNSRAGTAAKQYVRFYLKNRSDSFASKSSGFVMRMDKLLDRIEIGWDQGKLWDYKLVYSTSNDSGRPLLKTVQSDRTATQPEFKYNQSSHLLRWQKDPNRFSSDTELNPLTTKYFEGDFNGDGISDTVVFNPENGYWKAIEAMPGGGFAYKIYGNKFRGYNSTARIQFFKGNVSGDYNGDGRADIAMYLPETREFWIAEHNGRTFTFRLYGKSTLTDIDIFKSEWFPGDFDGNGLSDMVLFHEPTGEWLYMRNLGGRFEFRKFAVNFQNLFRDDYNPGSFTNDSSSSDDTQAGRDRSKITFLSGDYNGDNRTDISFYDARNGKWWVAENYRDDSLGFRLDWKVYGVFNAPAQALFGYDRFSGDFNGDGLSDFLFFNRENGEWVLGEVGDQTVSFRVFARSPQFKTVTRWILGDYNADGRTDIGFYSETDRNFWVGEATLNGFRFRIYNNLDSSPEPDRVLRTPLPRDEVIPENVSRIINRSKTWILDYPYDANPNPGRGERVFPGCFSTANSCNENPELLIFNRRDKGLKLKIGNGTPATVMQGLNLEASNIKLLDYQGNSLNRKTVRDEILFYEYEGESTGLHSFNVLRFIGASFYNNRLGKFTEGDGQIQNFNIAESLYLADHFSTSTDKNILILDDQASTARFLLLENQSNKVLTIEAPAGLKFNNIFRAQSSGKDRLNKKYFSFFSGRFSSGATAAQLLMVDRRGSIHKWYLGTLDLTNQKITFVSLGGRNTNNLKLSAEEYDPARGMSGLAFSKQNKGSYEKLIYARQEGLNLKFYTLVAHNGVISQSTYNVGNYTFNDEYEMAGFPILHTSAGLRRYVFGSGLLPLISSESQTRTLERPELMQEVYPFRWIQGDYNGDGKTDIGIFHIKESVWYIAASFGDVPDLLHSIDNGIGGRYELKYINSTSLDNTGDDDIPDLPSNYRLISEIHQDDGLGGRITIDYEYKNGYMFSEFIDGRRETDFFGFGEFTARDGYGGRVISTYHNVPYSDYRMNRALSGAIKEQRTLGYDGKQYTNTLYEYQLHNINQGGGQTRDSYLVTPAKVRKYFQTTLIETKSKTVTLVSGAYELKSSIESTTDHYSDAAHSAETIASYSQFETVALTNQQRPVLARKFSGSAHETTATFVYDAAGNAVSQTITATGSGLPAVGARTTEVDYDTYGNKTEERNVSATLARVKKYTYDTILNQFVITQTSVADSGDLTTVNVINYGVAFGSVDMVTDPNGNRKVTEFDEYGRLIGLKADVGSNLETIQTYSYSSSFPLSARTDFYTGSGDPTVVFRIFTDGLGREVQTVRSKGNGEYIRTGRIVYDAIGRVVRASQPGPADSSEINGFRVNLSERNPTLKEYDGSGRVKRITFPKAAGESTATFVETAFNDPWEVLAVDSAGRGKRTTKNARGHTLYVEDFGVGDDGQSVDAKIGFCYNLQGKLIKKSDLNGVSLSCSGTGASVPGRDLSGNNMVFWSYDAFGQLRSRSDPDLGVTSSVYNDFGDKIQVTDALGRVNSFTHDRMGRVINKTLPGGEGNIVLTYDAYTGSQNAKGRLVRIESAGTIKLISYDKLGRIAEETRIIKEDSRTFSQPGYTDHPYTTAYKYDLLNRTREIDYPKAPDMSAGMRVCYNYNALGHINQIRKRMDSSSEAGCSDDFKIISNVVYDDMGRASQVEYGNGATAVYSFDAKGNLRRMQVTRVEGGQTKILQDMNYGFDATGNIKSVANNADAYQTSYDYQYDGLSRLVDARGSYVESPDGTGTTQTTPSNFRRAYAYGDNGNLLRKDFLNYDTGALENRWNYNYTNHMVQSIDTTTHGAGRFSMGYDAVGNMITQNDGKDSIGKSITLNSRNRITSITDTVLNREMGRYWYDDGGFRVRKTAWQERGTGSDRGFMEVEIHYPSKFFGVELRAEAFAVNNVYLNGLRVAAVAKNGGTLWFMSDVVDSARLVLDGKGETRSRVEHMPYGEVFVKKGDEDIQPKYNSQSFDTETKFYFYNARYYDPQISRFVTADSIIDGHIDTQGWNRFSYTKGNPILYKDPSGHFVCFGICVGIVAATVIGMGAGAISAGIQVSGEKYNSKTTGQKALMVLGGAAGGALTGAATAAAAPLLAAGASVGSIALGIGALFAAGTGGSVLENVVSNMDNFSELNMNKLALDGVVDGGLNIGAVFGGKYIGKFLQKSTAFRTATGKLTKYAEDYIIKRQWNKQKNWGFYTKNEITDMVRASFRNDKSFRKSVGQRFRKHMAREYDTLEGILTNPFFVAPAALAVDYYGDLAQDYWAPDIDDGKYTFSDYNNGNLDLYDDVTDELQPVDTVCDALCYSGISGAD